jgi:hypothetical protein
MEARRACSAGLERGNEGLVINDEYGCLYWDFGYVP